MNSELLTFVKISNNGLQNNKLLQEQEKKTAKIKSVLGTILTMGITLVALLIPGFLENLF